MSYIDFVNWNSNRLLNYNRIFYLDSNSNNNKHLFVN